MSWNTGVDYARVLARSATFPEVFARYRDAVRQSGRTSSPRQTCVDAPGHCNFTTGEIVSAVDTITA